MNKQEYLFTCLAEECAEVAQVASKILRFGLHDSHEKTGNIENIKLLQVELDHIFAVVEMINEEVVPLFDFYGVTDVIEKKKEKVRKYMEYSIKTGNLTGSEAEGV